LHCPWGIFVVYHTGILAQYISFSGLHTFIYNVGFAHTRRQRLFASINQIRNYLHTRWFVRSFTPPRVAFKKQKKNNKCKKEKIGYVIYIYIYIYRALFYYRWSSLLRYIIGAVSSVGEPVILLDLRKRSVCIWKSRFGLACDSPVHRPRYKKNLNEQKIQRPLRRGYKSNIYIYIYLYVCCIYAWGEHGCSIVYTHVYTIIFVNT